MDIFVPTLSLASHTINNTDPSRIYQQLKPYRLQTTDATRSFVISVPATWNSILAKMQLSPFQQKC